MPRGSDEECFEAGWSRLYVRIVIVIFGVDELIEEFHPFLVQRLREESREMLVAHEILHDSECVMYPVRSQCTAIFVSAGEKWRSAKGNFRMSGRRDDARHGWPLERHDSMASAGGTAAHQRTQAFHSRDHGAHADPPPSGTCCRWHREKRRQKNNSALRLLFAFPVRKDARPSGPNDVQLGTLALEASVSKMLMSAGACAR